MAALSLCMIVKNEEESLARCLESVKGIVDEIVIVDTGSSDKTKEIAAQYTDMIYDFTWINDFSAARNFSYEKATKEYIMWLDADDIILPEDQAKLLKFKNNQLNHNIDVVMMKYNVGFDKKGNVVFSYYRERITKRERGYKWKEPVHEYIALSGNIMSTDIAITHNKIKKSEAGRNLKIYDEIIKSGKSLSLRGIYYYARELKTKKRYQEAIDYFNQFLGFKEGWIEDKIAACYELSICYKALNQPKEGIIALLNSLQHDSPRAEICCQIGYFFKEQKKYDQAIFWFSLALDLKKPENCWGFIHEDAWGYIPSMELCVCYYEKGEYMKAIHYNELAGEYKPNDEIVEKNKVFFKNFKNND